MSRHILIMATHWPPLRWASTLAW